MRIRNKNFIKVKNKFVFLRKKNVKINIILSKLIYSPFIIKDNICLREIRLNKKYIYVCELNNIRK